MSTESNKAVIRTWVEQAWNQGDTSSADSLYSPDYVLYDPALPTPVRGIEGIKGFVASYRAALPDIHYTIEDMVAEGDQVAWRWTVRATQRGTLMDIPPTGRQATVTGIIITRFANGKWAEDRLNWDTLGMLQQLGVIPAPAQPVG
jgi:steroid delta-isomerase-like uncharacterized protein